MPVDVAFIGVAVVDVAVGLFIDYAAAIFEISVSSDFMAICLI